MSVVYFFLDVVFFVLLSVTLAGKYIDTLLFRGLQ